MLDFNLNTRKSSKAGQLIQDLFSRNSQHIYNLDQN